MTVLVAFWALLLGHLLRAEHRAALRRKPAGDWVLDLSGLTVQGTLVPLLEVTLLFAALHALVPGARGSLDLPPVAAFALNFVAVDWLYYWNHRLLHTRALWPTHLVHHTVTRMDVLGTSRNTLWTSGLIVYLWVNALFLYLLRDPAPYAAAVAVTAALDLWRHSTLQPGGRLGRALSAVLVTPRDHAWHHAADGGAVNFGANLSVWDRLHGTWRGGEDAPAALGVDVDLPLARRLAWPWR